MSLTVYKLNTYFAMLLVTIIASGAALIIVHMGTAKAFNSALGNEAAYTSLKL
jgi:hypothetical protein